MSDAAHLELDLTWPWASAPVRLRSARGRLAVTGPSGVGKTTLVRAIAGVERRASGRVMLGDQLWQDDARGVFVPPWRRQLGWVPQDARLFPHVDVARNLEWSSSTDIEGRDQLARALGIDALFDRAPRNLSGGERQRVALARALLARPRALLLDEPFAALDRARRTAVIDVLVAWLARHPVPVVLISHDERDLERLADDVIELGVSPHG